MSTTDEIRTDITECEKKITRLERTWHLHDNYFDRQNAAAELDSLVQQVARQREYLAEAEAAERATQDTVEQLTAAATRSGNPAAVAVAYVISGVKTTATAGDSDPDMDEALRQRPAARIAGHLSTVGTHLTSHRPDDPMTEAARMTVALRTAGSAAAARSILRRLPFPSGGVTRGEYGHRVMEVTV
ncbi:hypothetical protein ACIOZL_19555 [Streptomyces sp. NPDC087769]|uniref:hypothetical protein n=1 Tax=Streptomyces sp. NPDC087769 TaxID=3365802 RepID=UPI0038202427